MTQQRTTVPGYSQRMITQETVAVEGQSGFFAGWDSYMEPFQIVDVKVNGVEVPYVPMSRQRGSWPMPSTASITRGVFLNTPASAGDVVAVRYLKRDLSAQPPEPRVIFAPGGVVPDPGFPLNKIKFSYSSLNVPNAILVDQIEGLQIEVWRKTKQKGMVRQALLDSGVGMNTIRAGVHWSPWWRSDVATSSGPLILEPISAGWVIIPSASNQRRKKYKLAYFNPQNGARTMLSNLTIYTSYSGRPDRVNSMLSHPMPSLWVA